MASSFKGWGASWGDSWGPQVFDPNKMVGTAAITFSAIGTLTADGVLEENFCYWGTSRRRVRVHLRSARKRRENDDALTLFLL